MARISHFVMLFLFVLASVTANTYSETRNPPLSNANILERNTAFSEGEIRGIDKELSMVTIKHGELKALDMPPMTMIFHVKEPATLDGLRVGDSVLFLPQKMGRHLAITDIKRKK